MSRNLSRSFDYLTNGVAYAVAEVENVALAAIVEVLYSKNMSLCKVGNVDIVTDTSSVWSVVISAVNGDCFTLAIGHLQNKRNKMTFRVMCLADCDAFTNERICSKMNYSVDFLLLKKLVEEVKVTKVSFVEFCPFGNRLTISRNKIICYNNFVSCFYKFKCGM